jgi:hypothetical protein
VGSNPTPSANISRKPCALVIRIPSGSKATRDFCLEPMPTFEIISIIVLAALAWLWFDSTQARAIAIRSAKAACDADGLQFLDDTVSIASLTLARNAGGQLVLRRNYSFDYSDTGDNRRRGSVVLLGHEVLLVNVGLRLANPGTTLR